MPGKRKSLRLSRQIQLSPVKESLLQSFPERGDLEKEDSIDTSDISDRSDVQLAELDLKLFSEKCSNIDWKIIARIEKERVLLFVHFREQNEGILDGWKSIIMELKSRIKDICIKVNQGQLLQDLHDTRLCNRLLEPESQEDAWRDTSRQNSSDYERGEETPYLEANLNMRWVPGHFQCPEAWMTTFNLHPRLKHGQGHSSQSWGMQAIRTVLQYNVISNRSDMFVYMDDTKNVFYIKLSEQVHLNYSHSILSRQTSVVSKEEETFSRTSSVGSSKQFRKSSEQKEDYYSSTTTSRSNSIGEADRLKNEDQIIFRVYGIEEVGKNIKEDLTAVLQKKLDDKVVEVISMMLKRNNRCKLASEDVLFLQKPNSLPTTTLRFNVHLSCMPYLLAIAYYLKQNLVHIPSTGSLASTLLLPNYSTGNTKRFRDIGLVDDQLSPSTHSSDSDIFLYNDYNEKGGRNGIAVLALSLVDGRGNLVKHFSHPKPGSSDNNGLNLSNLEEMIKTDLYNEELGSRSPGPGPIALIQFRIWESGRVDTLKLSGLLQTAIVHSMWDVVLEYKILPLPLCLPDLNDEDFTKPEPPPFLYTEQTSTSKLSLKRLSEEAVAAYGYTTTDAKPIIPQIIIERRDVCDDTRNYEPSMVPSEFEVGNKGFLINTYYDILWSWFKAAKELDVPSYKKHEVDLVCKHEIQALLKEIHLLIQSTVTDLDIKMFSRGGTDLNSKYVPVKLNERAGNDEYIILCRNFSVWKNIVDDSKDLLFLKKSFSKYLQNFPSLIHNGSVGESQPSFPSAGTF